nr:hypothetical protein OG461_16455 [Streptomyces sp. NBC_00995]
MSTVTLNPKRTGPAHGATAVTGHHDRHRAKDALCAVKVYAKAAFSVVVLGEYAQEAGVRRTR